jgi:hypothetical protein
MMAGMIPLILTGLLRVLRCPSPKLHPVGKWLISDEQQHVHTRSGPDDLLVQRVRPAVGLHVSGMSDPRDNSTASRQIPFPIAHLPADGRWEGRGTPAARAAEGHSHQPGDASRVPGPGQGFRISVRDQPRPFDPSVSPSTVRTIRGTSGRVGAARRPRRPGWADAGAEARGDPTTPES